MTRESEQVWQQRIKEQQESGLSCPVWCNSNGVAYSTFMKWRTKLHVRSKPKVLLKKSKPKSTSSAFIEVPVGHDPITQSSWDIELELGQGMILRLRRG